MKQVTQRLRGGDVEVLDVPAPSVGENHILVDVRVSLLSVGTERAKIETGNKSLIGKARARPDQVAQILEKVRSDGLVETARVVRARLADPSALGYSAAGIALAVGHRVTGITPGDRVAIGGADYAVHAEVARVPANLCARIPVNVSFEEGAFACVGSIALHAVRQANVSLGERVAVIGLGLVGHLVGMLLRAAGCGVIGVDLDASLVEHAQATESVDRGLVRSELGDDARALSDDCDAVIITAATSSSDPVSLAARLCRDRGRVVVVGDVGLQLPRASYYEKELEVRVSRSYGPGRYDPRYEEHGNDYPIGYVRWTEQRNFAAILELIASGRLAVERLVTARVPIDDAPAVYEGLTNGRSPLGIVIEYEPWVDGHADQGAQPSTSVGAAARPSEPLRSPDHVSVIGAGNFARKTLIPDLLAAGFSLDTVAGGRGISSRAVVEQFGQGCAGTPDEAMASGAGVIAIATRHASHAELAVKALEIGKHVFVEKPPALTVDELRQLRLARAASGRQVAVGFNRRYAPLSRRVRDHVQPGHGPLQVLIRVNVGPLPANHWLNDLDEGGGRMLGEGCHFVDLICWLVDQLPSVIDATIKPLPREPIQAAERFVISLGFPDGSLATVLYTDSGGKRLAKEYIEVHGGGRSAVLHDFRRVELFDGRTRRAIRARHQDKGHRAQFEAFRHRLQTNAPIEVPDPLDTMKVTLLALAAASGSDRTPEAC